MNTQLNILFLASWYPNKEEPQNGNFIERHAHAVALYANVAVLYVHSSKTHEETEIIFQKNQNITECIVYFPKTSKFLLWQKFKNYQEAALLGYERLLVEFKKFDHVHLNVFLNAGFLALYFKKERGLPFIITEHWTKFLDINPHHLSVVEKLAIRKIGKEAKFICPVSEDLANAIREVVPNADYRVIPNVVDVDLFKNPQTSSLPLQPFKILHISTLRNAHKNTKGMLKALALLHQRGFDFKATFIGNHYGDKYHKYASKLGLPTTKLEIIDEIPLENIPSYMWSHHLFMMFSNYENLPCVISEAHVAGLPVVASDVGGIKEMINEENGILVQPSHVNQLVAAIIKVKENYASYHSEKISQKAIERYSYKAVAKAFLDLYQSKSKPK